MISPKFENVFNTRLLYLSFLLIFPTPITFVLLVFYTAYLLMYSLLRTLILIWLRA